MNAIRLRPTSLAVCVAAALVPAVAASQTAPQGALSIGDQPVVEMVPGVASPRYEITNVGGVIDRRFQVQTADPVLCADFTAAPSSFRIGLTDANNEQTLLNGATSVGYNRGTQAGDMPMVHIQPSIDLSCIAFADGATKTASNEIFDARFEEQDTDADIKVEIIAEQTFFTAVAPLITYTIRVTNIGDRYAEDVRVLEFFEAASSGTDFPISPLPAQTTCTIASVACPEPALQQPAGLPLSAEVGVLRSGEVAEIQVTREVTEATGVVLGQGTEVRVQVAAFSDPTTDGAFHSPDRRMSNNAAVMAFTYS